LKCRKDHVFEAWFRDNATFEAQAAAGEVVCPVCGNKKIVKAPMAPAVAGRDRHDSSDDDPSEMGPTPAEVHDAVRKLRTFVEKNSADVGDKFAEEARKIHNGEAEARSIRGEATPSEAKALKEDGVPFAVIPWPNRTDS
jgi:hypothetical protein